MLTYVNLNIKVNENNRILENQPEDQYPQPQKRQSGKKRDGPFGQIVRQEKIEKRYWIVDFRLQRRQRTMAVVEDENHESFGKQTDNCNPEPNPDLRPDRCVIYDDNAGNKINAECSMDRTQNNDGTAQFGHNSSIPALCLSSSGLPPGLI
jgi:hypothetical protein